MKPNNDMKRSLAYGGSYAIDAAVILMMLVFVTSLFSQSTPGAEDAVHAYPMLTTCETCAGSD